METSIRGAVYGRRQRLARVAATAHHRFDEALSAFARGRGGDQVEGAVREVLDQSVQQRRLVAEAPFLPRPAELAALLGEITAG